MIHVKRFIDRVAAVDSRQGKDVVLPIAEARSLRDEIAKLLAEKVEAPVNQSISNDEVIEVVVKGGHW